MKLLDMTANKISRAMAIAVALCSFSVLAQDNIELANSIESISATSESGKLVVKVGLKSPPQGQPAAFTINTPPRIAFDFPNTENGLGTSMQTFGEGELRSANIVQAGNRTRLVINLSQMVGYDTRVDGNDVLITLQPRGVGGGAEPVPAAHFADVSSNSQLHSLRDIDFRRGKNGESRIQIDLSDADIGIDIKQQGRALIVDFQHAILPRNLQRKLDVSDFATPVQMIDAFVQGGNARLSIEPKGLWEYSAYQTDNKFIIEVKAVAEDPNRLVKGNTPGYSGEKLTLNFQNISTREALSVIADFTGLNMVISDSVSGSLTLRLKDVPWDQAFEIILQSRGLDMRKNGNVIQVAPREEIAAKEKIEFSSRQEITELEPLRTENFELAYAKAADVVKLISNDKQKILSNRGSANFDLRTNLLFVKDVPSSLDEVRKLIKLVDVPVRQVLIEARFVEAGESFNHTLGGRLGYTGPTQAAGGVAAGNARAAISGGSLNLPGAASGLGGLTMTLFNAAATHTLTLELNASAIDGTTKNIASPRVVTGDKTPATIESGVEVPYLQASSSGATNVAFKKAVLGLTVTPQITPDDSVTMKISVSQDSVGNIYSGVPSINTKKVDTQVLVDNGGTVVIGGVYTQDDSDSTSAVPGLADIPVLGWLFKTNTVVKSKKELLVFITPKILKDTLGTN
ncbi:MAG: type IV pilus secretin PilQ [Gammaproteobacteria bacterium]|nr:type IV pilus secretin PilQ [Gammaproteobacteria bacterium]MBU1624674.1 type IV pilus secretin PilQ [Gammaproteobacteria bacterium]MBU1982518.1 type IV pilus secretin PilQ [Gammaproteobacteria bacterium]